MHVYQLFPIFILQLTEKIKQKCITTNKLKPLKKANNCQMFINTVHFTTI